MSLHKKLNLTDQTTPHKEGKLKNAKGLVLSMVDTKNNRSSEKWVMPPTCRALKAIKLITHKARTSKLEITYAKCPACGGDLEVWGEEVFGFCLDCKTERHYSSAK